MTDDELVLKWRLQTLLRENIVEVTFEKADGTLRTMKCTLKTNIVPVEEWYATKPPEERDQRRIPEDVIPVWDIEKNAWRSFKVDKVLDFLAVRKE